MVVTYNQVAVRQNSQEIGVDAQDDGRATEDQEVQPGLHEAQRAALEETHVVDESIAWSGEYFKST